MKSLNECDVSDKMALAAFRQLQADALHLLRHDPEHSVWAQMTSLFWRDATYRLINEARKPANDSRPNAAISGLLGEFIDDAYVSAEVAAVGRLTDPHDPKPARGVVSLPAVLSLLKTRQHLITRENFVGYDGAPYDYAAARHANEPRPTPGVQWVAREPWDHSEMRHRTFDRLSGSASGYRHRTDTVKTSIWLACADRLKIDPIKRIRQHRNKVFAHAATIHSRHGLMPLGLSLHDVDQAHRAMLEVAETLSTVVTGGILIGSPVAIAQFDVTDGFDRPFAFTDDLDRLQAFWSGLTSERERWSRGAVDAVLS